MVSINHVLEPFRSIPSRRSLPPLPSGKKSEVVELDPVEINVMNIIKKHTTKGSIKVYMSWDAAKSREWISGLHINHMTIYA